MRKIGEKYRDGMEGLLDRFVSVYDQFTRINLIVLSMHKKAIDADSRLEGVNFVEGILTLLYSMMKEWEEV